MLCAEVTLRRGVAFNLQLEAVLVSRISIERCTGYTTSKFKELNQLLPNFLTVSDTSKLVIDGTWVDL